MKLHAKGLVLSAFWLFVWSAASAVGQNSTSGSIAGIVTDKSNAVMPAVDVQLEDNGKGFRQTATTNEEGFYQFSFLAPGSYTLTFAHVGFENATRAVDVQLGLPATVNVLLNIATNRTVVDVTAQAPLVRAENGDVAATITAEQVSQIPNPGGDITYLVQTAPGMIMNTDQGAGNFSNLGMPGTSNLFTVNGMMQNDFGLNTNISGALNLFLGVNEMEEVSVVSNGYSQFGGAAGANINYITKSGGNHYHGNASYYWNGTILNANNWFNNASAIPRTADHAHQWAAALGGPIKKNKLFFFFNTEGVQLLLPAPAQMVQLPSPEFAAATIANIDARFGASSASDVFYKRIFALYDSVPGAAAAQPGDFAGTLGCGPSFAGPNGLGTTVPCAVHYLTALGGPMNQWLISGRVDWNITARDSAFLLIQSDRGHQQNYTDAINPAFDITTKVPSWAGQLVWTHVFNSATANQFLLSGWWQGAVGQPAHLSRNLAMFPTVLDWGSTGGLFYNLGGQDNMVPSGRNATHFQISDDFTKSMGKHTFGAGIDYLGAYVTVFGYSGNVIGDLTPLSLDAFYQGGTDPATPSIDYTTLNQSFVTQASERFTFDRLGMYVKDEWHVRPNLTIIPSLRLEHQSNPVCLHRCFARLTGPFESVSHDPSQPYNASFLIDQRHAFNDLNNLLWSPRVSFAWQPRGLSRLTVLRGGVGSFFDPLPAILISPSYLSGNPPLVNSFKVSNDNLAPDETTSLFKDAAASNTAFINGFAQGQTLAEIQAAVPLFSPPNLTLPEAKTFSPQYQKWSFELQQGLGVSSSVTLGYYGNHGMHELVQNPAANGSGFGNLPAGPCSTPAVPPCADPRFGIVNVVTNAGVSNYNGLVVSAEHRFKGAWQGVVQANYTFGHAIDESSNGGVASFTRGSYIVPQDPANVRGSYGPAEYDVRHSFTASYVLRIPLRALFLGHGPAAVVNGWQVSGTVFARTGFPYTAIDLNESLRLANQNNAALLLYAVPVGIVRPQPCGEGAAQQPAANPCLPSQVLPSGDVNPKALFVQSGCETGFNEGYAGVLPDAQSATCSGGRFVQLAQGRNQFRGPGYVSADFAVLKYIKLPRWENAQLGFGAQFFNVFNHPNFGLPNNDISSSQFGQITYLQSPPTGLLGAGFSNNATARMIQLRVQIQF